MTAAADAPAAWPPHVGGRTRQPVRRHSQPFEAGEAFFRPMKKATVVLIMRAAERLAIKSMRGRGLARLKRRHFGELSLPDLAILEAMLFRFLDWRTGRCAPTYRDLEAATGHARDTIAKALARLKRAGILAWIRRFRRIEGVDGKGPQVEQAPNAYRFDLPKVLRALVGLGGESTPIPDDAACAKRDSFLGNSRQDAAWTGQPNLVTALDALGASVAQRESGG